MQKKLRYGEIVLNTEEKIYVDEIEKACNRTIFSLTNLIIKLTVMLNQ